MNEVWFYHITISSLENVLIPLLEKTYQRKWPAIVQMSTEERLTYLDHLLWTYSDVSFLPHLAASPHLRQVGDMHLQPLYLTCGTENPNSARVRIFIEGADPIPVLISDHETGLQREGPQVRKVYERCMILFDGHDSAQISRAERQWNQLQFYDYSLTYWQQEASGAWKKQNDFPFNSHSI